MAREVKTPANRHDREKSILPKGGFYGVSFYAKQTQFAAFLA